MRRAAAALLCILGATVAGPASGLACDPAEIVLLAESGPVGFEIEIADDPAEQARGLMYRPSLAPRAGMLFTYDDPRRAVFWMKNTMIPLDMIFLGDDGRVVNIAERTVPYSLEPRGSDGEVRAVLEINGGLSETLGIAPGTQAVHPVFEAAPEPHRCDAD